MIVVPLKPSVNGILLAMAMETACTEEVLVPKETPLALVIVKVPSRVVPTSAPKETAPVPAVKVKELELSALPSTVLPKEMNPLLVEVLIIVVVAAKTVGKELEKEAARIKEAPVSKKSSLPEVAAKAPMIVLEPIGSWKVIVALDNAVRIRL